MREIESVKLLIEPILEKHKVLLYEIQWVQQSHGKTLRVAIMHEDGTMNVDTCALVSDEISILLDEDDPFPFIYYLEVCSPGAERILKTNADIQHAIGKYVYLDLVHAVNNQHTFEGTLNDYKDDLVSIEYREKTRVKKVEIEFQNIKLIRLAVKI